MNISIEVCIKDGQTSTDKGRILEQLTANILRIQQYEVMNTVRVTGIEIDVLAQHKINNVQILVECKAWNDPLPADVITKLLGNVMLRNASAGWLMTTGPLSKDAAGICSEWERRVDDSRSKLSFYTADRIVNTLCDARIIVSADYVAQTISDTHSIGQSMTLILTTDNILWIVPVMSGDSGFTTSVIIYDAKTGRRINQKEQLDELKLYKSSYSSYPWLSSTQQVDPRYTEQLKSEFDSIVPVISGEDWTDYRPARPEDFVGRKSLLSDIFTFFENVNSNRTNTRLFAIKAPSGMGKSSVVLKIASLSKMRNNSKRYFVYAVDVRTAMSARYVEMTLKACFDKADSAGFTDIKIRDAECSNLSQYMNSESIKKTLSYLNVCEKTIILIFDQFEELFSKKELFTLFDNIRALSNLVDGMQGQFVLGFAWKTDLTIPVEHPAYYMWANLADRRKEFELIQFKISEIKSAISLFGKQLGERINPILSNYLTKQCQGYPWLLKKLCIHVFKLIMEGSSQDSVIGQRLNIVDLFERDISDLTPEQHACLKEVAQNSPADYFSISDLYGHEMIQGLINQRLIIRRASKLTLYWDIFRDYVINKSIPSLVLDYIPQQQFASVVKVLRCLLDKNGVPVETIAKKAGMTIATIDNVMIDAVMFGVVQKQDGVITLQYLSEESIFAQIQSFFRKHIVYQRVAATETNGMSYNAYLKCFNDIYSESNVNDKTKSTYCTKLFNWFIRLGLFLEEGGKYIVNITASSKSVDVDSSTMRKRVRVRYRYNGENLFWGQTSPERMEEAYLAIKNGISSYQTMKSSGFRNAIELLSVTQAIRKVDGQLTLEKDLDEIYSFISNSETICFAREIMKNSSVRTAEMGKLLNDKFYRNWTISSQKRYGNAILIWVRHLESRTTTAIYHTEY